MIDLKGKKAIVTGAARGIGKSIVLTLAKNGCDVIVADLNEESARSTASEVRKQGVNAYAFKVDVADIEQVKWLIKQSYEKFSTIDILINNAGITRDKLLMRMSEQDWDLVLQVNLKGAFNCTKQVVRKMIKQSSGKIINISSVVGVMGNAGQSNYAASKAGLIGFTRSIAKELGGRNIQVNAIAPGYIETEMTDNLSQDVKNSYIKQIPMNRGGTPEEVAKTVLFLASSLSDYITGQVIHVDGGMLTA
ncbi:MAG: 3-oxoacyl-[acyl-carrier-protein] reductase [bacterium]